MATINVEHNSITILKENNNDYISLTDIATHKTGESRAADITKTGSEHALHLNLPERGRL